MFLESFNLKHAVCPISTQSYLLVFFSLGKRQHGKSFWDSVLSKWRLCKDTLNKIIYLIERVRGENNLEDEDVILCWFLGDKFMQKFGTDQTYGLSFGIAWSVQLVYI